MASTAIILLQVISTSAQQNKQQTRLTIDELFNIVETSSKPLQVQRSSSKMAQAAIKTAEAQRLPDINTSLTFSYLGDGFTTDRNFSDMKKPQFLITAIILPLKHNKWCTREEQ